MGGLITETSRLDEEYLDSTRVLGAFGALIVNIRHGCSPQRLSSRAEMVSCPIQIRQVKGLLHTAASPIFDTKHRQYTFIDQHSFLGGRPSVAAVVHANLCNPFFVTLRMSDAWRVVDMRLAYSAFHLFLFPFS